MAKIPDWHDIGRPDYNGPSMLTPHDPSAMAAPGRAMSQLGESIGRAGEAIGGALASLEQQNNKQEDLDTAMKFRNFQADQDDTFNTMKRDMPEDGTGFRDNFSKQYYDGAKNLLSQVPDRLKGQYDAALREHHISYEREARTAEFNQQDKYTTDKISGSLDNIYGDLETADNADPTTLNKSIQQGQGIIDASPLPPNRKLEMKKRFSTQAETRYFDARRNYINQNAADPNANPDDIENQRDQLEQEIKARGQNPLDTPTQSQNTIPGNYTGDGSAPGSENFPQITTDAQRSRPHHLAGELKGLDHVYKWGSGGMRNAPSIPYGSSEIGLDHDGPVMRGLVKRGVIPDQGLELPGFQAYPDPQRGGNNANSQGIVLHAWSGKDLDDLQSLGCFTIPKDDWPAFRKDLMAFQKANDGKAYLNVLPNGEARITSKPIYGTPDKDGIQQIIANQQANGVTPDASRTAPNDTSAPVAGASKPLGDANLDGVVESAAKEQALDPDMMRAYAHIESGGDPRASTGSYQGLFQLSPDEFRKNGGTGSIMNPEQNARAAAVKLKGEIAEFKDRYDRDPAPGELYMIHQQGKGGAEAHWDNPSGLAWQNLASTAEGRKKGTGWAKRAIWGNLTPEAQKEFGSVDNVTSKQCTDFWNKRVAEFGGNKIAPESDDDTAQAAPAIDPDNPAMRGPSVTGAKGVRVASLDEGGPTSDAPQVTPGAAAVMQAGLPMQVQDRKGAVAATIDARNNVATVLDGVPDDKPLSSVPADVRNQIYGMFPAEAQKQIKQADGSTKSPLDVMTVGAVKAALASQMRQTQRIADANGGLYPQKPTFNYITENDRQRMLKQIGSDRKAFYDQWSNVEAAYIAQYGEERADGSGQTLMQRAAKSLPPASVMKIKAKLDKAKGVFTYVNPLKEMDDDSIDEHLDALKPNAADTPDVATQKQAVLAAATTEANRVRSLRQKDIAKAADELPEVGAAQSQSKALLKSLIVGQDANGDPAYTNDRQAIAEKQRQAWEGHIQARKDAQDRIGIDADSQRILTKNEARDLFGNVAWNKLTEEQQQQALVRAANKADATYGKFARQAFNEAVQQVVTGEDNLESASKISADLIAKMARQETITSADVNRLNNAYDISPMETFARGGLQSNPDWNAPGNWNGSGQLKSPTTTGRMGSDGALPAIAQPGSASLSQAPQKAIGWLLKDPVANSSAFDRMYGAGTSAQIIKLMAKLQSPQGAASP